MSSENSLKRPLPEIGFYITRSGELLQEIEEIEEYDQTTQEFDLDISNLEYLPDHKKKRSNTSKSKFIPPQKVDHQADTDPIPRSTIHIRLERPEDSKSLPFQHLQKGSVAKSFESFPGYHSSIVNKGPVEPRCLEEIVVNGKKYLVLKPVGEGGSGKVFLVFSFEHTETFALKWVKVKGKEELENVKNEMGLMRLLKESEHTIKLLDHEITPQVVYMIMEYGELDFSALIKMKSHGKWDIAFIRYYWKQMLLAVNATHEKNIIHSDLKPANFIVIRGSLKLIDFGIAAVVPDYTTHIERDYQAGTRNFMAPETFTDQYYGKKEESGYKQGRPSDIWSLGCILYQMVFGLPPFYHVPKKQIVKAITDTNYEIEFPQHAKYGGEIVTIPEALNNVLKMCLHRNPQIRPTMNELLSTEF